MARDLAIETPTSHQRRLLQIWLSPSFPVGAYAYSHGLEWAAEAGLVRDRKTLRDWIGDLFTHGSIRNDLILLAAAWHATSQWRERGQTTFGPIAQHRERGAPPISPLRDIAELAAALHPSAERKLESITQGGSFLDAIEAAWPVPPIGGLPPSSRREVAYPVAIAIAAAGHGIALDATLEAYAVAFVGNLASAAIRLSLIGQTDAQRLQADMMPAVDRATSFAASATLDDLGGATFVADLCSAQHETQYTRLFRS